MPIGFKIDVLFTIIILLIFEIDAISEKGESLPFHQLKREYDVLDSALTTVSFSTITTTLSHVLNAPPVTTPIPSVIISPKSALEYSTGVATTPHFLVTTSKNGIRGVIFASGAIANGSIGAGAIGDSGSTSGPKSSNTFDKEEPSDLNDVENSVRRRSFQPSLTSITPNITSSQASLTSNASTTISRSPCAPSCFGCNLPFTKPKIPRGSLSKRMKHDALIKNVGKRRLKTPKANHGGNVEKFMLSELAYAERLSIDSRARSASTALNHVFENHPYSASIVGLHGCTSVIVASRKAVWLAHFWEISSFRTRSSFGKAATALDIARFDHDVIWSMTNGNFDFIGLKQLTVRGGQFHSAQNPVWTIVTPYGILNSFSGRPPFLYDSEVAKMSQVLQELLPGAPNKVVDYVARSDNHAQRYTASGKILFQYDPVQALIPKTNDRCEVKSNSGVQFVGGR